jgi:outer membrane protein assembly factor BamB
MNRQFLWASICLQFVVFVSISQGEDWPQFLGPRRNGTCVETGIRASWPAEGPPILWRHTLGQGFSGPIVRGTNLLMFHRVSDREVLECLDASKGTLIWSNSYPSHYRDDFGFDEGPRATPAATVDRVYTYGAEGVLTCWNRADGKSVWTVDARKEFKAPKGFFGIACSPLVDRGLVLLNLGGDGAGIVGFDAITGKVRWKATDQRASYSSPTVAEVHGEHLAFVLTREGLVVLKPDDGTVITEFPWRPPMEASVSAATPLVIGDQVFLSTSYERGAVLLQLDGKKLRKIWAGDDQLSNHYATSIFHKGQLFGFDGRQEQGCNLRSVDFKTGKVNWSQDGFGAGTVTLVNDELFVLTEKGELLRAPATSESFKPSGRAQILPFQVRAYPAFADGKMYARSKDKLVCVNLR